jgi:hypothetical protein
MNALEIVTNSASVLITVIHALEPAPPLLVNEERGLSGVRSKNITPCAKKIKMAGQRDISHSARPLHSS